MPRLGVGMPIIAGLSQEAVTTIDDFFFESNASGEVNPIQTASRTNLIAYSEDFSQWIADSVDTNVVTSPDGQTTADRINFSTTGALCRFITASGDPDGKTFTNSVFLKADTSTSVKIIILGSGSGLGFLSETVTLTTEWQRFSVSQSFSGTGDNVRFRIESTEAGSIFAWGAQVEQDSFVSAYIPTSGSAVTVSTTLNDTSEVWDFDGTDIMLEADPEDEGFWEEGSNLVLNHDYEDLGSELVDFPNASITLETGWSFTNGILTQDGSGAGQGSSADANISNTSFDLNKQYKFTITVSSYTSGDLHLLLSPNTNVAFNINGTGEFTVYGGFYLANNLHLRAGYGNFVGSISNLSIKQVDPNDRWSLTNTTISDGVLNFPDNSSAAQFAIHSNATMMDIGGTYEITLTVNKTAGGVLKILSGTGGSDLTPAASVSSSGTHTFIVTNNTNGGRLFLYTTAGENFQGTVDNVTVREYAIQPQDV